VAELGCADPEAPCRLPNAFVADPPLEQVVARTLEIGLRGSAPLAPYDATLGWTLALFRTDAADDILFVASEGFGRGYFRNAGETRRQGIEADLSGATSAVRWYASYAFLDATFRTPFVVASPSHPAADAAGEIAVEPGDPIPGIPRHQLKVGVEWRPLPRVTLVANAVAFSSQTLRGDEAALDLRVPGGLYVDVGARWQATSWLELFVQIENVFDARYETFGTYAAADDIPGAGDDPRAVGPGAPIGAFGGIRIHS
jgi:iron complex outermembrane recepter protein